MKIVIAEPDRDVRAFYKAVFAEYKEHQIHLCATAAESVAECKEEKPDLIITELFSKEDFHRLRGENLETPVLLATTSAGALMSIDLCFLSNVGVLEKPFNSQDLLSCVSGVFNGLKI